MWYVVLLISLVGCVNAVTNPNDYKVLNDFRNGLENSYLLKWPRNGNDPCGPPTWQHIECSNGRVTAIQVQSRGLKGPLPQNLNQLDKLKNVGFQKNKFYGKLPSFSGLSDLEYAYLDLNEFDTIPADFFSGLINLMVLALDQNPLNQSSGWSIPRDLAESTQLVNFSCSNCNIVGQIPDFFGDFSSLSSLRLSSNRLSGEIPSSFDGSLLQNLFLNDQEEGGMRGPIDVIGTMPMLTRVWLHGNQFTGPIPDNIGTLTSLTELSVNRNQLVGLIPPGLASLNLQMLDIGNNMLMGPIPKINAAKFSYGYNSFCQPVPGVQCAPEVNALLDFLRDVKYPVRLASEWKGNDPCVGRWLGISCNPRNEVSVINMRNLGLNGTISPSLSNLHSLVEIHLEGNHLQGSVPENLTQLRSLRLLDLSGDNVELPQPKFGSDVKVVYDPASAMGSSPNDIPEPLASGGTSSNAALGGTNAWSGSKHSKKSRLSIVVASAICSAVLILLVVLLITYCLKRERRMRSSGDDVIHHKHSRLESSAMEAGTVDGLVNGQAIDAGSLVFTFQVLREVTNNFSQENVVGRGGFGVVYRGQLVDDTMLAVKRMEAGVMSGKGMNEFQTEIAVLSTVRHRHLVSLLGYSCEGNERLLVYEYMPQGALSRHLFLWKTLNLDPLCWAKRLNIALDVAKGVEYLHSMAQHSFIHRDLKSANILLDDEFRAKVSDFGLVKLALDTDKSFATRLAGTFGYMAPEYAGRKLCFSNF